MVCPRERMRELFVHVADESLDRGRFMIYVGTSVDQVERAIECARDELRRLLDEGERTKRNLIDERLLLLSLDWPSTLSPLKAKGLSRAEEARFRDFSCLKAQCYKPSDRAMLLEWIRADWGSEEAFDDFVRTELLQVMRKSKARYFSQVREIVVNAFELVFGD